MKHALIRRDRPQSGAHERPEQEVRRPHLALLHADMLLAGFGMVFLGPVLPFLAVNAHAADNGSGLFFTAQFAGAFLGGMTTSSRLWRSLMRGSAAAAIGFFLLSLCVRRHTSVAWDAAALLPLGFGVGQMLTSVNLLVSQRFVERRGAALSLVNFSLSLGAVLGPLALGLVLPVAGLHTVLLSSACLFAVAYAAAIWNARRGERAAVATNQPSQTHRLRPGGFAYFGLLLLLYGGVETSISGWITTFGTRYGSGTARLSALGATALWSGITAGRALAPLALRKVSEGFLLKCVLFAAAILVLVLSQMHSAVAIIIVALLLGFAFAPWFPLVLAAMLNEGAAAGQVGTIIAISGLGAATLPLLVGAIASSAGSLRVALIVPSIGLLLLLCLSFRSQRQAAEAS